MNLSKKTKNVISYIISALGALGSALQNYMAVDLFIRGIVSGFFTINKLGSVFIHGAGIGLGGICSGMINFFVNIELIQAFLDRLSSKTSKANLNTWQKFRYWAGSFVFVVTGILFGLTALTIGMATPLFSLAVVAGIFVSMIMIIQEVETWLQSFDDPDLNKKTTLQEIFLQWKSTLTFGKACGHLIAIGNVVALSLLFTLGLSEFLIIMSVAALPAFIIGAAVAFTFGAFTEFYFYNFFLAKFCASFQEKWQQMKESKYGSFGFAMVVINGLVNGALTYSGIQLLTGLLVVAGIGLPPVGVMIGLAAFSAVFAGGASFLLGMDFWVRKMGDKTSTSEIVHEKAPNIVEEKLEASNDPAVYSGGLKMFKPEESANVDDYAPSYKNQLTTVMQK